MFYNVQLINKTCWECKILCYCISDKVYFWNKRVEYLTRWMFLCWISPAVLGLSHRSLYTISGDNSTIQSSSATHFILNRNDLFLYRVPLIRRVGYLLRFIKITSPKNNRLSANNFAFKLNYFNYGGLPSSLQTSEMILFLCCK